MPDWFQSRQRRILQSWRITLNKASPPAQDVLIDLARTCYYAKTTVSRDSQGRVDASATLVNEGRRQVFLDIMDILELEDGELRQMAEMRGEEDE